jgi:hypothetical protein
MSIRTKANSMIIKTPMNATPLIMPESLGKKKTYSFFIVWFEIINFNLACGKGKWK